MIFSVNQLSVTHIIAQLIRLHTSSAGKFTRFVKPRRFQKSIGMSELFLVLFTFSSEGSISLSVATVLFQFCGNSEN